MLHKCPMCKGVLEDIHNIDEEYNDNLLVCVVCGYSCQVEVEDEE